MNRQTYMHAGGVQDSEQIWAGMSAAGFDHEDILLALAPKPVHVLAVTYDFFPIEGARRTVERAKRIWELYGEGDQVQLFEDVSLHHYTSPLAASAARFFSKVLNGMEREPADLERFALPVAEVQCTKSGQMKLDFADARIVHDENLQAIEALQLNRSARSNADQQQLARKWLEGRVMNKRLPSPINLRRQPVGMAIGLDVESLLWWSQAGMMNHAMLFRKMNTEGEALPVTIAVWDDGSTNLKHYEQWIRRTCESGRAVLVLDSSGVGPLSPWDANEFPNHLYGTMHRMADELIWQDDSIVALRTYDVLRSLDLAAEHPELTADGIQLFASGRHSMYAQLAAYLDDRITNLQLQDGFDSVASWIQSKYDDEEDRLSIIIPGMLAFFDLPDIRKWLASQGRIDSV